MRPADYLLDTLSLKQGEHGAYCLLMFSYYWNGSLPIGRDQLYEIARASGEQERANADAVLARYFKVTDDAVVHNRIERELDTMTGFLRTQSARGKASAEKRAKKIPKTNGTTPHAPGKGEFDSAGFDPFYAVYPRHEAKEAARMAWAKLAPDEALQAIILAAVMAQRATGCLRAGKTADGRSTIPHAASWLNAKRWQDEVKPGRDPDDLVI